MNCDNAILVGCSATPYRDDGEDLRIEAAIGKIISRVTKDELVKKGYLVDAEVRYIPLTKPSKEFLDYHEAYEKFIVNNKERNDKIVKVALRESKNRNVLILIQKIEHGRTLQGALYLNSDVCFMHGGLPKKERIKMFDEIREGKYNVTIATSLFDEGIDIHNFEILILGVGGKSSVKVVQRVGRLLRPFPGKEKAIIYDFIDEFKWLREHYQKRREILEEDFEAKEWDEEQQSLEEFK